MDLSREDIALVRQCMLRDAGLVLDADKDYLVATRLGRLAREKGTTVADLLLQLRRNGDLGLQTQVVEQMAIKETYFFRDPWLFDALRERLIPALMQHHSRHRSLRLWCAAAATGQEIYSICLLLLEHFPELADWDVTLVASDFSAPALAQAAAGRYTLAEVNRGLPARLLTRYFNRVGLYWEINEDVRRMVEFRCINLVEPWPSLPPFDLVLLRNVLIYFESATRHDVLSRVGHSLRKDGYLLLGGGETPVGQSEGFLPHPDCRGCYCRVPAGAKQK